MSVKFALGGTAAAIALVTAFWGTYTLEEGEMAAVRNGSTTVAVTEPGIHWRTPMVSTKNTYNELSTICFDASEENGASLDEPSFTVKFADTYKVDLNVCFRLRMPTEEKAFLKINRMAKGNYNLLRNTYKSNLTDLMTYTAAQFRGEDFMQGGQNEFLNRLADQAKNGKLVTRRKQVEISTELANAGVNTDNKSVNTGKQLIWKSVVQLDKDGNPLRVPSTLGELGIEIAQVTMTGEPVPEPDLIKYMGDKKSRIQARASIIEEQETERQKAKTEKLRGDRERIQAKQNMLREKDAAEIDAQKKIALASAAAEREIIERNKVAELAKIDKARELQVAKDNEGIQKANAAASKYEAMAILEKGLAEAKVEKAKYEAIDKEVLISNNNRDVAIAMYNSNIHIDMPEYVNIGGEAANQSSVEEMSTIKLMEQLRVNTTPQQSVGVLK